LPLYQKSLADKVKLVGKGSHTVAVSQSNLAELHLRMRNPDEALTLYQQALAVIEVRSATVAM
jgi:hypothetical protein